MNLGRVLSAISITISIIIAALFVGSPAQAAPPPLSSCQGVLSGVTSTGQAAGYYFDGTTGRVETYGPESMGFVPRDIAGSTAISAGGAGGVLTKYFLALHENVLYEVKQVSTFDMNAQVVHTSYTKRTLGTTWAGIRQISFSHDREFLYALTNAGGVVRYSVAGDPGEWSIRTDRVFAKSGWGSVKGFSAAQVTTLDGQPVDVFTSVIASTGELVQYAFARNPSRTLTWARKQLKASTWGGIDVIGHDLWCPGGGLPNGLLGVHATGSVHAYYDADPGDFSGADISSLGTIQTTRLPITLYNE